MSQTPGDARLSDRIASALLPATIAALATLYDRFANAIDPDESGIDDAEKAFNHALAHAYDFVVSGIAAETSLTFRDFRREVIRRCKLHLKATDKISGV